MARILFVTEVQMAPPHAGHRLRCSLILQCLEQDHAVVVLAPEIPAESHLSQEAKGWLHLPPSRRTSIIEKLYNVVFILLPRPQWSALLRKACQMYHPELVWFSLGHWGQYASIARQYGAATVMDTHNIQSKLTRQEMRSKPAGGSKFMQLIHFYAERLHERTLFRNFDCITSVSEHDRRFHSQCARDGRSLFLPNFVDEQTYRAGQPVLRADHLIALTGSFSAFQNFSGARWFLQECWPEIHAQVPYAQLQIIGSQARRLEHSLLFTTGAGPLENVTFFEDVPEIAPFLNRAAIAVVPIFYGSGTRFKVLEALACHTPVVSTTKGAEGLNLKHSEEILIADTPSDFARCVIQLLQSNRLRNSLAEGGYARFASSYSLRANQPRIQALIRELTLATSALPPPEEVSRVTLKS